MRPGGAIGAAAFFNNGGGDCGKRFCAAYAFSQVCAHFTHRLTSGYFL
jgi:hypothetical protein